VVAVVFVAVLVRAAVAGAATDWSSPALLSSGTLRSAPVLAVDAAGDAFAAWTAYDGSGTNTDRTAIEATQRSASGAFAQPETLQRQDPDTGNPASGGGDSPSIGVADDGTATLTWRPIGNDRPVFATRTLSVDWGAPSPLAQDVGDATGQVFVEPGGHAAALVDNGCLSTNLADPTGLVCVADPGSAEGAADVLSDGSAVMATADAGTSGTTLIETRTLAADSTSSSTFGSPVTVATEPAGTSVFDLQLRVTDSGDAYLAFLTNDGSSGSDSLVISTFHGGAWSPPTSVSGDAEGQYSLTVDRGSGSMILAWAQSTATTDLIEAATAVSPTAPLSSPVTLDSDSFPSAGVSAAASGAGTGVVAWAHSDGSVQASLLASSGFGSAETISEPGEQATEITAAARGVPALLWTAQDGTVQTVESATATPPASGPTPQSPVCFDTTGQVLRNGSSSIGLTCSDASGRPITISIVGAPGHGSLGAVDQGSRSVVYTPSAGYTGSDTFAYQASDGTRMSAVAQARISVVFHPPVCGTGVTTETNAPVTVVLACANPDGYPLTLSIVTPPKYGTLSAIAAGYVVYTPDRGYAGDDSFGYVAKTADGTSYAGTASILVYATPSWWSSQGITVTSGGCLGLNSTGSLIVCWVGIRCPMSGNCTVNGNFGGSANTSPDVAAGYRVSPLTRRRAAALARPFRVTLRAGAKRKVPVMLTRAGRAQLKSRGKLTLILHLTIREGGGVVMVTKRVHIRLVKRSRQHHE
jgi:hypothetical protein